MTSFGKLYEELVVMPGQPTFPAYYMLVRGVIKKMKEDFPHLSSYDWGDKKYGEFYEKWFGSELVKNSEE